MLPLDGLLEREGVLEAGAAARLDGYSQQPFERILRLIVQLDDPLRTIRMRGLRAPRRTRRMA